MEKAIEIKRRAQRFVQSGDVDAALGEYEKLARAEENEPYHAVVIADLLYKKGDAAGAATRYLSAIDGYEQAGLFKNGIAVCKKMARLSLAPGQVFQRLAQLHQRDGLSTESSLYFMQHAEYALRANDTAAAAASFRLAYDASPENVTALERLAELHLSNGDDANYTATLNDAAAGYERLGQLADAKRVRARLGGAQPEPPAANLAAPATTEHGIMSTHAAQRDPLPDVDPLLEPRSKPVPAAVPHAEGLVSAARHLRDPGAPSLADPHARVFEDDAPIGIEPTGLGAPPAPEPVEDSVAESVALEAPQAPAMTITPATAIEASVPASHDGATNGSSTADAPSHGSRPGIQFESVPAADDGGDPLDPYAQIAAEALMAPEVSGLIEQARGQVRSGAIDAATQTFARAAQAWDTVGKAESAANVYRVLHAELPPVRPALMLWFDNCRRRGDRLEASGVALGLGDEALRRADARAAREWFERAFVLDPANDTATERLRALPPDVTRDAAVPEARPAARPNGNGAHPPPTAPPMLKPVVQPARASVAEAAPKIEVTHGYGDEVHMELDQLLATFRRDVQHQVSGDPQSNYALGVSYLEMGLGEQAIESLRAAAEDPALVASASELIGRCHMDSGRFEDAATEFRTALDHPAVTGEAANGLRFELGIALEAAGRLDDALAQFERLYAAQPNYPDVAMKIRLLRKTLENE